MCDRQTDGHTDITQTISHSACMHTHASTRDKIPVTGVGSWGMQGIWHPNYLCGRDIDMYIPYKNLIPSHANCMQHVLRCWERQSDGSEYKKTLRRPGLRPEPPLRELTALPQTPLVGRGWLSPPQEPHPHYRPFGPRLFYPHSRISSNAHDPG